MGIVTTTTTTTTENNDSGANFRGSQPIQPTKTENAGEERTDKTKSDKTADEKDKIEKGNDQSGRFGMAGKSAAKISFRILTTTNLSLSFKPYASLKINNEFCIKPGGINGKIKPFTSSSGRKQFKKVGIRINYTIKQLLSVRNKFKSLLSDIDQIPDVLEEGLGVFETLTSQTITLSSSDKISPSKLKKPTLTVDTNDDDDVDGDTASTSTSTTEVTSTSTYSRPSTRYDGNDDDASFRSKKTVTPSAINVSKLKKTKGNTNKNNKHNRANKKNK